MRREETVVVSNWWEKVLPCQLRFRDRVSELLKKGSYTHFVELDFDNCLLYNF